MISGLVRGFTGVMTAVITVIVATTIGESAAGKILGAIFIAAFIVLVEWLQVWTPKHFATARRLLDPRSALAGAWLQIMGRNGPGGKADEFALFWVDYGSGNYQVAGSAFDGSGEEVARWSSTGEPDFSPDGQSMTYFWEGEITGLPDPVDDIDRKGVARFSVRDRKGRVDHLGMRRILLFDLEPVSHELLSELGLAGLTPEQLKKPDAKRRFAVAYAKRLTGTGAT